jgi:hypothetical protein
MAVAEGKKLGTHERRLLESESRWLQKALFALSKAEDDRMKLEEAEANGLEPMKVEINGKKFEGEAVTTAMREAVTERSEQLRVILNGSRLATR